MQTNLDRHNPEQLCRDLEAAICRLTEARAGAQQQEAALSQAGVYTNGIPSESWEGPYLRLVWATDPATGKRDKVYVGNNPKNITAHHETEERTLDWRRWQHIVTIIDANLESITQHLQRDLATILCALARATRDTAGQSCTLSRPESGQPEEIAP